MKVIFGTSGHARELELIFRNSMNNASNAPIDFFVSENNKNNESDINEIAVIGEKEFFTMASITSDLEIFIGIGEPATRKKVVDKINNNLPHGIFPNLFYRNVVFHNENNSIELGSGNIFFPGVTLTTNILIGNHNHFNINCSINHDCRIGDFNTISPGVRITGNVLIGNCNFLGVETSLNNNICICDNTKIGSGSVVIKSISESGTYVGVPAKRIK